MCLPKAEVAACDLLPGGLAPTHTGFSSCCSDTDLLLWSSVSDIVSVAAAQGQQQRVQAVCRREGASLLLSGSRLKL